MSITITNVITKDGGGSQDSVTTDLFTPASGALLVVGASSYAGSGDDNSTLSISDSLGLTWTKRVERSQNDDGSGINPPPVVQWTAVATGAQMTVTTTRVNGAGFNHTITVHELDGSDTSNPIVATAEQSTSGAMQLTLDTTGVDNCLLIGRMVDWSNTTNVPVADANSTTDYAIATAVIQANWAGHRAVGVGGSYAIGTSFPSSGTTTNAVAVAIRPGAAAPGAVTLTPAVLTLTAQAVTPAPGMVTVNMTPAGLAFNAQTLTPAPGMVTVNLTPATLTLVAVPGNWADTPGTLTATVSGSALIATTQL